MKYFIFDHIVNKNTDLFVKEYENLNNSELTEACGIIALLNGNSQVINWLAESNQYTSSQIESIIMLSIVFNEFDIFKMLTNGFYTDLYFITAAIYERYNIIRHMLELGYVTSYSVLNMCMHNNYEGFSEIIEILYTGKYIEFDDNICELVVTHAIKHGNCNILQYCTNYSNLEKLGCVAIRLCDNNLADYVLNKGVCMELLGEIINFNYCPTNHIVFLGILEKYILNGLVLTNKNIEDIIYYSQTKLEYLMNSVKIISKTHDITIYSDSFASFNDIKMTDIDFISNYANIKTNDNPFWIQSSIVFEWLIDQNYDFSEFYFNYIADIPLAYEYIGMYGIKFHFNNKLFWLSKNTFDKLTEQLNIHKLYPNCLASTILCNIQYFIKTSGSLDELLNNISLFDILDNFDATQIQSSYYFYTLNLFKSSHFPKDMADALLEAINSKISKKELGNIIELIIDNEYDTFTDIFKDYYKHYDYVYNVCEYLNRTKFIEWLICNYGKFHNVSLLSNISCDVADHMSSDILQTYLNKLLDSYVGSCNHVHQNVLKNNMASVYLANPLIADMQYILTRMVYIEQLSE